MGSPHLPISPLCRIPNNASLPAAAQQWTPKQRAACEPDAMRLCNQRIDTRWGALNADLMRKYAGELVALEPDVVIPYQSTRP
jgi:hypothetical protein